MAIRNSAARRVLAGTSARPWKSKKGKAKIAKIMHEWKAGKLHSGSKKGPIVKSQKQAVAISLAQARRKA